MKLEKKLKNKLNKFRYRMILLTETQFNVNVEPLCSILIHIIHWRTREMTEHTEKDVLMK